jgi:hypothetical protein
LIAVAQESSAADSYLREARETLDGAKREAATFKWSQVVRFHELDFRSDE